MTIEPFKVQGMTFHLDSWEEADNGIWTSSSMERNLTRRDRIVTSSVKVIRPTLNRSVGGTVAAEHCRAKGQPAVGAQRLPAYILSLPKSKSRLESGTRNYELMPAGNVARG